jgi:hypothetical protein
MISLCDLIQFGAKFNLNKIDGKAALLKLTLAL